MSSEPVYEVVSPVGQESDGKGLKPLGEAISAAGPVAHLSGKKVGLIWTTFSNGNILLEALGELLSKRFPGLELVKLPPGRNLNWGDYPDRSLSSLAREQKLDAAIVAAAC